jgi:hypothetical protein
VKAGHGGLHGRHRHSLVDWFACSASTTPLKTNAGYVNGMKFEKISMSVFKMLHVFS